MKKFNNKNVRGLSKLSNTVYLDSDATLKVLKGLSIKIVKQVRVEKDWVGKGRNRKCTTLTKLRFFFKILYFLVQDG